jgi:hypothetical protein
MSSSVSEVVYPQPGIIESYPCDLSGCYCVADDTADPLLIAENVSRLGALTNVAPKISTSLFQQEIGCNPIADKTSLAKWDAGLMTAGISGNVSAGSLVLGVSVLCLGAVANAPVVIFFGVLAFVAGVVGIAREVY